MTTSQEVNVGDVIKWKNWEEASISLAKAQISFIKERKHYEKTCWYDATIIEIKSNLGPYGFSKAEIFVVDNGKNILYFPKSFVFACAKEIQPVGNYMKLKTRFF